MLRLRPLWILALALAAALTGPRGPLIPRALAAPPPRDLAAHRRQLLDTELGYRSTSATLRTSDVDPAEIVPGEATVTFAGGVSDSEAAARIGTAGGRVITSIPSLNVYRVALAGDLSVDNGIAALSALPDALRAEPLTRLHSDFRPNDQLYASYQTYLPLLHAEQAWDMQQGDPGVVVAVIDSGVELTHPDLATKIWTNPNPGAAGCGNDLHGCNFVDPRDVDPSCPNQNPAPAPNPDVRPYYWHGSFVAGIIGAATNNGIGIAGVAPRATIMPIKVGDCRYPTDTALAAGILYAAANGGSVINLSIGGSCRGAPSYLLDAIAQAQRGGAVVVAAAGNDNQNCVESPASADGVIAVGATALAGQIRAKFSNWGPQIAVVAPGEKITSTLPPRDRTPPNDLYGPADGTSFSAPMVAGLAQLLLSQNGLLTPTMVRGLIQRGAVRLADGNTPGWAGAGRIDLAASLRLAPAGYFGAANNGGAPAPDGTPVEAFVGRQSCGQTATYSDRGQSYYTLFVAAAVDQPGCGATGTTVSFTVAGRSAGSAAWRAAALPLDLNGGAGIAPPANPSAAPGSVLYRAGWNLVAGPAGTLFSSARNPLYTLQPGDGLYQTLQTTTGSKAGLGYWAFFAQDTTVTLAPDGQQAYVVQLPPGQYVLIGSPSGTHAVSVTGADDVLTYDPVRNSYVETSTLLPGQGAWAIAAAGASILIQ